jgi:hypothetical protein
MEKFFCFRSLLVNTPQLHTQLNSSESESYVMTDGQSASLSRNIAPIWDLRPDSYYCQTVAGLLMWGALPDVRTGLWFTIAAGVRRRSHSRVQVPWDSWSYFTVSDSRLPFSSPPTTRRTTVEIFDLVSTREFSTQQKQKLIVGNQPARSHLASGPAGICSMSRPLFFFPFVDPPYW